MFQVFLQRGGGAEGSGWESRMSRPGRWGREGPRLLAGADCRGEAGRGRPTKISQWVLSAGAVWRGFSQACGPPGVSISGFRVRKGRGGEGRDGGQFARNRHFLHICI